MQSVSCFSDLSLMKVILPKHLIVSPLGFHPPYLKLTCITALPQFRAGWYGHHRAGCVGMLGCALWWRNVIHLVHLLHMLKQPGRPPLRHNPDITDAES